MCGSPCGEAVLAGYTVVMSIIRMGHKNTKTNTKTKKHDDMLSCCATKKLFNDICKFWRKLKSTPNKFVNSDGQWLLSFNKIVT